MPAPQTTHVKSIIDSKINVSSDPVAMLLYSLVTIGKAENLSGYDAWIKNTANEFTPEQMHNNSLVMMGLHYAALPVKRWDTFPQYIEYLKEEDPKILRDRIFYSYEDIVSAKNKEYPKINWDILMSDKDAYIEFISSAFNIEHIDLEIESEAYDLMVDLPKMKNAIVSHLEEMWVAYLQPEWNRILPTILECVDAYQEVDLAGLTTMEAAEKIIGQELTQMCKWALSDTEIEEIVFVPSTHVGPYVGVTKSKNVLWINFGARLPEGSNFKSPSLSRAELLVRLDALADDNRLQILALIVKNEEMCSKDIIDEMKISQSAASRHLKQLSATGYLIERRKDSAKCYKVNEVRVENTIDALTNYFGI